MQIQCPFPDCSHRGEIITKVHCRQAHNMEREEVFKKYGKPKTVYYDNKKLKQNRKIRTIYNNNYAKV